MKAEQAAMVSRDECDMQVRETLALCRIARRPAAGVSMLPVGATVAPCVSDSRLRLLS